MGREAMQPGGPDQTSKEMPMEDTNPGAPGGNAAASSYQVVDQLKDGRSVTIRAVRPDDKERLRAAFQQLEAESIHTRLFAYKEQLTDDDLKRLTEIDFDSEVALVVTVGSDSDETIVGSGRYFAFDGADGGRWAEIAFMVEEDYQGLGISRTVLRHLTMIARARGIVGFEAEVLPGNKAMLAVFAGSGLPLKQTFNGDTVQFTLALGPTPD